MKKQVVLEVNPKNVMDNLSEVSKKLNEGWLVKRVIVCYENCVHYLLEKEVQDEM